MVHPGIPGESDFGVVWSPSFAANHTAYAEMKQAAATLNLKLTSLEVTRPADFDAAFKEAAARTGGVAVLSGPLIFAHREPVVAAAARYKVPAIYYDAEYAQTNGLVAYGPSLVGLTARRQLTGFGFFVVELIAKRFELLSELVPNAKVDALLTNPKNPQTERVMKSIQASASAKAARLPDISGPGRPARLSAHHFFEWCNAAHLATELLAKFPMLQIEIYDASSRKRTLVK